jgi:hypothetical protein
MNGRTHVAKTVTLDPGGFAGLAKIAVGLTIGAFIKPAGRRWCDPPARGPTHRDKWGSRPYCAALGVDLLSWPGSTDTD